MILYVAVFVGTRFIASTHPCEGAPQVGGRDEARPYRFVRIVLCAERFLRLWTPPHIDGILAVNMNSGIFSGAVYTDTFVVIEVRH